MQLVKQALAARWVRHLVAQQMQEDLSLHFGLVSFNAPWGGQVVNPAEVRVRDLQAGRPTTDPFLLEHAEKPLADLLPARIVGDRCTTDLTRPVPVRWIQWKQLLEWAGEADREGPTFQPLLKELERIG